MLFHSIHGSNIVLEDGATKANRWDSFCHGITFSETPIDVNTRSTIMITQINEWNGALCLGVTNNDPLMLDALPRYACPDLTSRDGFWADAISEKLVSNGSRISFCLTENGNLELYINNEYRGSHLIDLPVHEPLWILLDIYGNTESVQFMSNDSLPAEIIARGPQAMYAFRLAKNSGTLPVFRTRLVLVGQDGSGKTSLKHLLTGQKYREQDRFGSENVLTTGWCEINQHERGSWLMAEKEVKSSIADNSEGYFSALAANIAKELLIAQRYEENEELQDPDNVTSTTWTQQNDRKHVCTAHYHRRQALKNHQVEHRKSVEQLRHDLLHELPEYVVEQVDNLVKNAEDDQQSQVTTSSSDQTSGPSILLNIWDLSGKAIYHAIHQAFLSSRAIYLLVFNLCEDLDAPALIPIITSNGTMIELEESEMTNLDELSFWLNCIHAHTISEITTTAPVEETSKPAVIIVGTHKKSLHPDPEIRGRMIEDKFKKIEESIRDKSFCRHVVKRFFAVDSTSEEDEEVSRLRECIEVVVSQESYIGEEIPVNWLKFEEAVSQLVEKGIPFISRQQLQEIAKNEGIDAGNTFSSMLDFYHDLGVIVHYGSSLDDSLLHTVILDPEWLMDAFGKLFSATRNEDKWPDAWNWMTRLKRDGILEDGLINTIWTDYMDQKTTLLALMDKFDLLCELLQHTSSSPDLIASAVGESVSYFMVNQVKKNPDVETWFPAVNRSVCFYFDFVDFLPISLFHRLVTRALKWSQEYATCRHPRISSRFVRLCLDVSHDFVLQMAPAKLARIKVIVTKVIPNPEEDLPENDGVLTPKPIACAKVRHFVEGALADIRAVWMKRLLYKTCVDCICGRKCFLHQVASCQEEVCLHFLLLDECLTNKVVLCDFRRVKTHFIRQHFPAIVRPVRSNVILPENSLQKTPYNETVILDNAGSHVPRWIKSASKLLNAGSEGNDWTALASRLGYKPSLRDQFSEDLNPGLALISDWLISSGNTQTSVDMLVACLTRIHRDDIVDIIQKGHENDDDHPPVFLSYQWDVQEEVLLLRTRLELAGFRCWMDVGQMGGGDHLHVKLYEGINNAKVFIACVTPKYVVSHVCGQEVTLADLLGKPIIPAMIQETPWPPPGGMAIVLGQLLYVDFDGSGGHGGGGIHSDWESRFHQLILRITHYVDPVPIQPLSAKPTSPEIISARQHRTSRLSLADLIAFPLVTTGQQDNVRILEEDDTTDESLPSTPRLVARGRVQRCTICTIV